LVVEYFWDEDFDTHIEHGVDHAKSVENSQRKCQLSLEQFLEQNCRKKRRDAESVPQILIDVDITLISSNGLDWILAELYHTRFQKMSNCSRNK
jgi:hypothetical protein